MNEGFGKDFYRKGNSVKRSGPFSEPPVSFFGTFPIVLGFSRFARGWSGDFPGYPFPLSRPIKSTYEEQSRKGPRHNLDLSRKKWEHPGFGNPGLASPN